MEYADFDGFVMTKPCPTCNSELVYTYTDKHNHDYHGVKCTKASCTFVDERLDEEFLDKEYGGLAPKQQCGKELLDMGTIASIDRLSLDIQQLQDIIEKMKNCANCAFWFGIGRPCEKDQKALPIMLVCPEWKRLGEEEECDG